MPVVQTVLHSESKQCNLSFLIDTRLYLHVFFDSPFDSALKASNSHSTETVLNGVKLMNQLVYLLKRQKSWDGVSPFRPYTPQRLTTERCGPTHSTCRDLRARVSCGRQESVPGHITCRLPDVQHRQPEWQVQLWGRCAGSGSARTLSACPCANSRNGIRRMLMPILRRNHC